MLDMARTLPQKHADPCVKQGSYFWHILSTPPAQALDGLLFLVVFRKASGKQNAKKKASSLKHGSQ